MPAEQLISQQIRCPVPCVHRGSVIDLQHLLHLVKCFTADQRRDSALYAHLILEQVYTRISFILEDRPEGIFSKRLAPDGAQPFLVQQPHNVHTGVALCVFIKDQLHRGRGIRVDDILFRFRVNRVSQRTMPADGLTLLCAGTDTPADVLGELQAVILCHALQNAFQNDTLRAVWNGLGDVLYPDIILFAAVFVECDLLTISPETVYLPDDDDRKLMLCRIGQHLLESLAVVVLTRFSPVNVFFDDGVPLCLCVHLSRAYLTLYALFCLRMR